jgi:acyl-CoA reductase-like NAD-dependent aldehyde dehydrogenase
MALSGNDLDAVIERVVTRLSSELAGPAQPPRGQVDDRRGAEARYGVPVHSPVQTADVKGQYQPAASYVRGRRGIFDDLDTAVSAARSAFEELNWKVDLATRDRMLEAMRAAHVRLTPELARMAVEETGLGRVEDKIQKNLVAARKTPGREILRPLAFTGDDGLTLHERAPFGVIGSITPTTNPTETIINNAISMVAGGNTVVFNVHPSAKGVSRHLVEQLNDAIVAAGGPENCVCALGTPTIDSAQALMKHPGVRVVVVTGGPAVVKAAMSSGKRAVCAGPGNPPVVVDETADLAAAARSIVAGASLDNNIICIVEKEIFAVERIAGQLLRRLEASGAVLVSGPALSRLEKLVVTPDGHPVKEWVGKDAAKILRAAGVTAPDSTRLALAETDAAHPFVQLELLMPVVPLVRVPTVDDAIREAVRAEHGFFHTAVMHSTNIDHMSRMAQAVNTSLFVKNAPSYAGLGFGGEGHTAWTIAGSSGDGLTTALTYTRERRCTLKDAFRIV